jgi:transposase
VTQAEFQSSIDELQQRLQERDRLIAALRDTQTQLEGRIAALESSLVNHASENEWLKRQLFGVKSERSGTNELQLTLGDLLAEQEELRKQLDKLIKDSEATGGGSGDATSEPKEKPKPKGRRNLELSKLPKVVVELTDPELEKTSKVIGYEESRQLMFQRGGFKVLVRRQAKYEVAVNDEKTVLVTPAPKQLFPRTLGHSSLYAHLAIQKFALGVPHHRLEKHLEGQGEPLDRGTMGRWMEDLGNTLGATIVHAMFRDAIENCSVLSTDATGAAIQPEPNGKKQKRACRRGHFFTIVADARHVLFAYTNKHSQDFVAKLFHGFRGLIQSDASSVYDILDRGPPLDDGEQPVALVGCWAHCRRYFFDAAVVRYPVGVEGLTYIQAIYRADMALSGLPPSKRKRLREERVLPLVERFYAWVHQTVRVTPGRTPATRALNYAINQEQELRRVFLDGRLPLDNTRSERALRTIVVGRKAWMFYGSDVHAEAAASLFTIIASCRLHCLDPESYFDEVIRVLPYWPRERYLELAPVNWAATRARLDHDELAAPWGTITVPPPP